MTTGLLALLEVLLIFGSALAVGLYQLYRLHADQIRTAAAKAREKAGADPSPRS